ncbi:MAG: SAM-dependent chlorinase/fluorinase [Candidatus Eisenbacteria bacterium]|uniref:SAM-dependent chlorinase/fluorinase n=1 Tax=Eiseniibacteriota bacterium TaxID=2212470 RepID=A0A849SKY9_UNCEI|nr:SAM-dependent chlorinase/fluorinase [Candidatus Eisenbacteria bacterium]
MNRPLVTFTSDFGLDDWFVGVVRGVLHSGCPEAHVVDITHSIPPGDIERAVFVVNAAARDFPPGTVHLVVVDPGVGTARRGLVVRAHNQIFVGPDNGVLESALGASDPEVHSITNESLFRPSVSATFHGRDVFAPIAAALAGGAPLAEMGPRIVDPLRFPEPKPERRAGELVGRIMFVDRFGNLLTNLKPADIQNAYPDTAKGSFEIVAGGLAIRGLQRTYGDAPFGSLVAVLGSSGRLEIAQVGGSASHRLGLTVRDEVHVKLVG